MEIITLLSEKGCEFNIESEEYSSPIERACAASCDKFNIDQRIQVLNYLINEKSCAITAACLSNSSDCLEITKYLLDHGANPNLECGTMTPLISVINRNSIESKHISILKILLEYGADLLACDKYIGNSLHLAAERGHINIFDMLVNEAKKKDKFYELLEPSKSLKCNGMNAYQIAVKYKQQKAAQKLKSYFPKI